MSELLGKFFGKEKQQGGKGRDKSPAVSGDRSATGGATSSASAQGSAGAADYCTYPSMYLFISRMSTQCMIGY